MGAGSVRKWFCRLIGHRRPVYHESRAFWWCPRCDIVIGMNPKLWTYEALVAHQRRKELGEYEAGDKKE